MDKKLLFFALFLVAFIERVVFDLGPNVEMVTTALILGSYYLGKKRSMWLILLILISTDIVLGNTKIFIFTWSGFLIPAIITCSLFKKIKSNKVLTGVGLGLTSNLFFFVWTNFGVWLQDLWGLYPKTLIGLVNCYINALPFLKNQLIGSLIFIPLGFYAIEAVKNLIPRIISFSSRPYNFIFTTFKKVI